MPLMMKNTSVRCLGCNADVTHSAKVLSLMMSTLGRDETVLFFSLQYEYQSLAQYISLSQKHNH